MPSASPETLDGRGACPSMTNIPRISLRTLWRPPRPSSEVVEDRRVTFLELFYDLVYVVVIAEVGHYLAGHVDAAGISKAAFLFTLVWLAWLNGSMYHEWHGRNDLRTRVFTFAQMFAVGAMAVFVHSAFGEGAVGFALSFASHLLIVAYLWWRTGIHDAAHRSLSNHYAGAVLLAAAAFAASALVPVGLAVFLWGGGGVVLLVMPFAVFLGRTSDPGVAAELERSLRTTASTVERFGLFTIIVLGEVIVGVVRGVAGSHELGATVGATAALGMFLAFGLWWLYFDFVSHRPPTPSFGKRYGWIYLHLTTGFGIVAVGAATLNIVEHASGGGVPAEARWLLAGAMALALLSIAALMRLIHIPKTARRLYRGAGRVTVASAAVVGALGFSGIGTIPLMAAIGAVILLPVFYGLLVWITVLGGREIPLE